MPSEISNEKIDWNEMWKNSKLNSTWRKLFGDRDTVEYWDRRAASFDRNTRDGRGDAMAEELIRKFGIDSDTTVLDIGAGTGRLAVPLARVARSVTAVEPSGGMLDILIGNAETPGLHNIEVLRRKWEEVELGKDFGQHDVVIACHSLSMMEIGDALAKMDAAAGRYCCIYSFGSQRIWDFSELWPKLYGEEFVPGPPYIYLVNILLSMGIDADVEVRKRKLERRYSSLREALEETKIRLDIHSGKHDSVILDHLSRVLVEEEGKFVHHNDFEEVMIRWEK